MKDTRLIRINSIKKVKHSILMIVMYLVIIGVTLIPSPILAGSNKGRQIGFSVEGGARIAEISISGFNQKGEHVEWHRKYEETYNYAPSLSRIYVVTEGYWWVEDIDIKFSAYFHDDKYFPSGYWAVILDATCHIEYLKETTAGDTTPVVFTLNQDCTGEAGNVKNYDHEVGLLYKGIFGKDDSLKLYNVIAGANDRFECWKEIGENSTKMISKSSVGKTLAVIKIGWACAGVLIEDINSVLKRHGLIVVMESSSSIGYSENNNQASTVQEFSTCQNSCNGFNTTNVFPEGTKKIFIRWKYDNIPTGSKYIRTWSMDNKEWARYTCLWTGTSSGTDMITLTEPKGLHSGIWDLTISINGTVLLREKIKVLGNWKYWDPAGSFNSCYGKR